MKWFSFRMRAISVLSFETGMSTRRCRAWAAFRMRASMSAIGSVIMLDLSPIVSEPNVGLVGSVRHAATDARSPSRGRRAPGRQLPARLPNPRDLSPQRHLSEADAAQPELPQERPGPPATHAPLPVPHFELRLPLRLLDQGLARHLLSPLVRRTRLTPPR